MIETREFEVDAICKCIPEYGKGELRQETKEHKISFISMEKIMYMMKKSGIYRSVIPMLGHAK
ncbi:MAG: hypothetical protein WA667_08945 [Candidatus Nitrosopolaris sp.]